MCRWEPEVEKSKPPVRRGYDHHHPSFASALLDSIYRSIDDETRPDHMLARGAPHRSSRWAPQVVTRPRQFQTSASSSSDCSSCGGGFSFSETESVAGRPKPNRLGSIRTDVLPPSPEKEKKKKIKILGSIRSKLRDLKNMFNSKHKSSSSAAAEGSGLIFRSCLVKTPKLAGNGGERTVKFHLPLDDNYGGKTAAAPTKMTWRVYEEEEDDVASDSSSDLFELENLVL